MTTYYFKGKPYTGEVARINSYNGYEKGKDHEKLCAVINNSCSDQMDQVKSIKN